MQENNKSFNIIVAVVLTLTAGTTLYLAWRIGSLPDEARVQRLIEERTAPLSRGAPSGESSASSEAKPGELNERQIVQLIDRRLAEQRKHAGSDEEFNARVERAILAFVEKQQRAAHRQTDKVRPVGPNDHVRGNPAAPVALIEYSDFECPFCKRFHETVGKVVAESQGQVKWVYRHFPLDQLHPVKARQAAVASECATELGGDKAFWEFTDRYYDRTASNNRTDTDKLLPQIAREIGLDETRFAACVASNRHNARIEEDYRNAVATGGTGTPWSIVVGKNGKTYPLSGAQPEEAVKQIIQRALQGK